MKFKYYLIVIVLILAALCVGLASAGIQGIDHAALIDLPPESAANLSQNIATVLHTFSFDEVNKSMPASNFGERTGIQNPTITEEKILSAVDGDDFGDAVAISGDTVVVGADYSPSGGASRGQAYVFSRNQGGPNNWGLVKTLSASDKADYDYFGRKVAVSGDIIIVGAPQANSGGTDRGQAYVFSRNQGGANNWGQVKILSASDKADTNMFGWSVAVSGDTVVIGAIHANSGGLVRGQAYVFSQNQSGTNNWGQVKILSASDKADRDYFGNSVAISGDIVVVGAHYTASGGTGRGQAYIFSRNQGGTNNWGEVKILSASDKADNDHFGYSVAVSDEIVIVGAYEAASGGTYRGQVYVFSRNQGGTNTWGQVKILSASDKADNDWFGYSVAVSGDTGVIGAFYAASGGTNRGKAYVFSRNQGGTNNWGEVKILSASDMADHSFFGSSVAVSGATGIIGSSREQAYVFLQLAPTAIPSKIGVFRPSSHMFYLKNGTTTTSINWGTSTDKPVTGDWNGDGRSEVGVFRNPTHMFYLKNGTTTTAINWGASTDKPVTGDWNGDGRSEVGVFRNSTHTFYLKNGTTTTSINWGISTDLPVTGDWNGDGRTDVGVYRPSAHTFYLKNGTTTAAISWGINTDLPVTGDWNGDGRTEVGVFRNPIHMFYLKNGTTTTAISWGVSTDLPVTGKW